MKETNKKTDLAERLGRSADAKKALMAKFKAKPTVADPEFIDRASRKAAELEAVRQARTDAKESARLAKIEAEEAKIQVELESEEGMLAAQRAERKARKAQAKADAKAKKEAKSAGRRVRVDAYG